MAVEHTSNAEGMLIELDESLYPKDAIYGAAYVFIDRCYVKLDRPSPGRLSVRLKPRQGVEADADAYAGEFENELLSQTWRRMIVDENRQLIEQVTTAALSGAAGPPGLDDLLAMDLDEDTAFEDPLGIAMSWEEKYKKKDVPEASADAAGKSDSEPDPDADKK
ncbi:MAG TPA: His-Xaa-Ser system protein HxsD [Polyangiaceae bacterium]|nr:His-Xaa-Ser system protein HxsD [Polyangiaceae bacterium]